MTQFINCCAICELIKCAVRFINCADLQNAPNKHNNNASMYYLSRIHFLKWEAIEPLCELYSINKDVKSELNVAKYCLSKTNQTVLHSHY